MDPKRPGNNRCHCGIERVDPRPEPERDAAERDMAEAVRDEREPAQHDKDAEACTGDGNDKPAHKRPHAEFEHQKL